MRKLIRYCFVAAVIALSALSAVASPACLPANPNDVRFGVVFNPDGSAAGAWGYWWCSVGGVVTYEWRAAPSTSFTPSVMLELRAYVSGRNPSFASTSMTLPANSPVLATLKAAADAAAKADTARPVAIAKP